MYGFLLRPRWIGFHLLVIAAIVAMVNFGFWQLDRLDQRREFNAQVEARTDLPARALDEMLLEAADPAGGGVDVRSIEWRQVTASGTYLPDEQFLVVNRSQNGRPGDNVVTPLDLGDGRTLLVNRGFVPIGFAIPDAPTGPVTVRGIVRPSQERRTGQLSDPSDGPLTEVQRIDIERLAAQLPGEVVPLYVDVLTSEPADADPFPEPVVRPDLSEGPHLSYAVQWFIFAVAVAVGWVLAVRRSITKRRADAAAAAGSPPSAVDEPATALSGTPDA